MKKEITRAVLRSAKMSKVKPPKRKVFLHSFTKKPLKIEDFSYVVPWGLLEEQMTKRDYKLFSKWMSGQTVSMHGPYIWDVSRFLHNLPVID